MAYSKAYTMSTQFGGRMNRDHNRRTPAYMKQNHIDPYGVHETWKDEAPQSAYKRLFGPAVEEYNGRQKRQDRRIDNYYKDIATHGKKSTVYEMVATVGNMANMPDADTTYRIYRDFTASWPERNPNLEIIGAYYHADEPGAPHVHIDYVPVARGYVRGPAVQSSLTRALVQQGITVSNGKLEMTNFYEQEQKTLESICRAYGLDIRHPKAEKAAHLDTQIYRRQQALKEAEVSLEKAMENLARVTEKYNQMQGACDSLSHQYDSLQEGVAGIRVEAENIRRETEEMLRRQEELQKEIEDSEMKRQEIQASLSKSEGLRKKYERLRMDCAHYLIDGQAFLKLFDERERNRGFGETSL